MGPMDEQENRRPEIRGGDKYADFEPEFNPAYFDPYGEPVSDDDEVENDGCDS